MKTKLTVTWQGKEVIIREVEFAKDGTPYAYDVQTVDGLDVLETETQAACFDIQFEKLMVEEAVRQFIKEEERYDLRPTLALYGY